MSSERILRLKRAEDALHSFVLLHVVGEGNSPLALKLTASDGEQTFRITSRFLDFKTPSHSSILSSLHPYLRNLH
jgi:hypothetical protein